MRMPNRPQTPLPIPSVRVVMCDRCGEVTVGDEKCRCSTPYDEAAVRRRHRDAIARARANTPDRGRRRSSNPAA